LGNDLNKGFLEQPLPKVDIFPWNAKYETVYRWLASFIVIYTIMNLKKLTASLIRIVPQRVKGTNPFLTLSHASSWEERSIFPLRTGKRDYFQNPLGKGLCWEEYI